jgi:CBS domain-containing protein
LLSLRLPAEPEKRLTVRDIMKTDVRTVTSSTRTLEAIEIMQTHRVGCLPVVDNGQLVGIVTSYDFLAGAARLFEAQLSPPGPAAVEQKARAQSA